MSVVSLMHGLTHEAGAGTRALARMQTLACLALGAVAFLSQPGEAQADSGREWLEAMFAKPSSVQTFDPPQKLGVHVPQERRRGGRPKHVRTASLGPVPVPTLPAGSATGEHRIRWAANAQCLASSLRTVIAHIAANYGSVRVSSTCRGHERNRRVGGARRSYHLSGNAADFRVFGNVRAALAYLRTAVGGLKHYGGGLFHIDTGPRRRM